MEKFDLDALLEKNPHLDKKVMKKRQQQKKRHKKRSTVPASPYGQRQRKSVEEDGWGETVSGTYRPHYRGG